MSVALVQYIKEDLMKVNQKVVDNNLITLDVVATAEEVDKAFFNCSVVFAQQNGLKPEQGKTPAQVAQERLGITDLDAIVADSVVEYLVPFAIDKKGIAPEYVPVAKPKSALVRGQEFAFELPVAIKPQYELTSYEPVEIELFKYVVNEELVDSQLQEMAESFAQYEEDEPRIVGENDACCISMKASINGEPMPALDMEKRIYITNAGFMPAGFDENVIGMNVGETKTFTISDEEMSTQENQETIECTVTVESSQKKIVPVIDDEWVKQFLPMVGSLAELRANVAESVDAQQRAKYEQYKQGKAVEALVSRFQGNISDGAYESMANALAKNIQDQIAHQGMTWDQFVEAQGGKQQFNIMMMMQVRQMLVQGYCLDAIYRHAKLKVTDDDIIEACATMNPQSPEAVRYQMESTGRGFALREIAERLCATKYLVEHAKITYAD